MLLLSKPIARFESGRPHQVTATTKMRPPHQDSDYNVARSGIDIWGLASLICYVKKESKKKEKNTS